MHQTCILSIGELVVKQGSPPPTPVSLNSTFCWMENLHNSINEVHLSTIVFLFFFSKSNQEKIILCIDFCETLVCKFQTCTNAWFVYYVPVQLVRRRVLFKSRSIGVTTFWIQILRPSGLRPTSTSFPHHITARRKSAENPFTGCSVSRGDIS